MSTRSNSHKNMTEQQKKLDKKRQPPPPPETKQQDLPLCPDCQQTVKEEQNAVECEVCQLWFHQGCQNITDILYSVLTSDESGQISWYCNFCKRGAKSIMSLIKNLSVKQTTLESNMKKVTQRVEKLEQHKPTDEDSIKQLITTEINEYREREVRKCNVLLHNMPEPVGETPEERKQEDEELIYEIAQEIGVDEINVKQVIRLGKKSSKPRLTKVELESSKQKRSLLQKAKQLRDIENEDWKNIFISPDLSPLARQQGRDLRNELKTRKEDGETDLIIRKGKIIKTTEEDDAFEDEEENTNH